MTKNKYFIDDSMSISDDIMNMSLDELNREIEASIAARKRKKAMRNKMADLRKSGDTAMAKAHDASKRWTNTAHFPEIKNSSDSQSCIFKINPQNSFYSYVISCYSKKKSELAVSEK